MTWNFCWMVKEDLGFWTWNKHDFIVTCCSNNGEFCSGQSQTRLPLVLWRPLNTAPHSHNPHSTLYCSDDSYEFFLRSSYTCFALHWSYLHPNAQELYSQFPKQTRSGHHDQGFWTQYQDIEKIRYHSSILGRFRRRWL